MEYRVLPHGGEKISVIGMGSAVIGALPEEKIIEVVREAVAAGVNILDMAGGHASIFPAYGKALAGIREQVYLQVHFGADYTSGAYGWTTELEQVRASVAWQLKNLQTDYIDFGYIHCLDEEKDLAEYEGNGVLDYILDLKKQGIVRHIGLSSHAPAVVNALLDRGILDVVMFSINPLYDYGQGDYAIGSSHERQNMYIRCQKEDVAIIAMKPYCGGQMLDGAKSPLGIALTEAQCLQYVLDKPGVIAAVPGCGSREELAKTLRYLTATEGERDYAILGSVTPVDAAGRCVYCNHCHPCPRGIDIAMVNKFYDLTKLGDELAREHYYALEKKAGDCISCGHCNTRCPFHVDQIGRMAEISAYFGA